MTDNMFGYQINFGRKQHRKARWKKARKRYALQYAKLCEKLGVQNDLPEGRWKYEQWWKYERKK